MHGSEETVLTPTQGGDVSSMMEVCLCYLAGFYSRHLYVKSVYSGNALSEPRSLSSRGRSLCNKMYANDFPGASRAGGAGQTEPRERNVPYLTSKRLPQKSSPLC